MSKDTVTNQNRSVAGIATTHVARVDQGLDWLWLTGLEFQAAAGFDNYIKSKYLDTGKTTHTFIQHEPIWTAAGLLDAEPSKEDDPSKSPVGGIISLTRNAEAEPTSWSLDVFVEGCGVVRDKDLTLQNHKNATGIVNGPPVVIEGDAREKTLALMCSVVGIEGECRHGRHLAFPPGDAARKLYGKGPKDSEGQPHPVKGGFYLEVVGGDKKSTPPWFDKGKGLAIGTAADPEARAKGDPARLKIYSPHKEVWESLRALYNSAHDDVTLKAVHRNLANPHVHDAPGVCLKGIHPKWAVVRTGQGKKLTAEHTAKKEIKVSAPFTHSTRWANSFIHIFDFFKNWREEAPVILVVAEGCSGSRTAIIKAVPGCFLGVAVATEKLKDAPLFKHVGEWVEKRLKGVASHFGAEFEIESTFKLSFEGDYRELTEDKNNHNWAEVGPNFKLALGFDPFVAAKFRVGVGILKFLGGVGLALKALGVYFDLQVGVDLSFVLNGYVGADEYGLPQFPAIEAAIKVEPLLALVLGVKAGGSKLVEASGQVSLEGSLTLRIYSGKATAEYKVEGEIQFIFKITFSARDGALKREYVKKPKWGKWKLFETDGKPLPFFGK